MSRFLAALVFAAALVVAAPATAQEDPPGRVGRIADARGGVSWYDAERGEWDDAERNRPLTSGDRLSTAPQGSAELRVGSTVLRLGGGTELELQRVDDERLVFQLHRGSLALRVKTREKADEIEIATNEVRLMPQRAGHYRIDRTDDSTFAGAWRGDLRIDDAFGFTIATGQRAELWRERARRNNGPGELRHAWSNLPADDFADRVIAEDRRDEQRTASNTYVSPEMTGAEELDRFGRWDRHPEYGAVWYPASVRPGWAPYRHGRWAWVRPWGWTWVDEAPWGFAPFHYGRWVFWNSRWGWCPGAYVARPVYAPALVAWIGGPRLSVSVQIGGPTVGWVPLAPREAFHPYYRHTPRYSDRVNGGPMHSQPRPHPGHGHPPRFGDPPQQVPTGPIMYGNQGVPGAVTVVPRDALLQRQPVNRVAVGPEALRNFGSAPLGDGSPPPGQAYGPQRPASAERPAERGSDRRQDRDLQQRPSSVGPMPAPERAMERQAQPQPQPQGQAQPALQQQPLPPVQQQPQMQPQRPVDRTQERNGEQRNQTWPRRGFEQSAPDARRERVAPTAQPAPAPAAPQLAPAPALAPEQAQGPQRPPQQPAAAAPPPTAAPAPAAVPRPAPERARDAQRAQPPEEERGRGPAQRDGVRERENAR